MSDIASQTGEGQAPGTTSIVAIDDATTDLLKKIKAHVEKGEKARARAEQHDTTIGVLLKQLKSLHPGTWEDLAREHAGVGRSRSYDLIAIAEGRADADEKRAKNAEANRRLRSSRSPSRDGQQQKADDDLGAERRGLNAKLFDDGDTGEQEDAGDQGDDVAGDDAPEDTVGFLVAIVENAADKTNLFERNLHHLKPDDDRAPIVEAIDAAIAKWQAVKAKIGAAPSGQNGGGKSDPKGEGPAEPAPPENNPLIADWNAATEAQHNEFEKYIAGRKKRQQLAKALTVVRGDPSRNLNAAQIGRYLDLLGRDLFIQAVNNAPKLVAAMEQHIADKKLATSTFTQTSLIKNGARGMSPEAIRLAADRAERRSSQINAGVPL